MLFTQLTHDLNSIPRKSNTLLVAIDGHGGSGKTFFTKYLKQAFSMAGMVAHIVAVDGFSRKREPDDYIALNDYPEVRTPYRIDAERLKREVLEPLHTNANATYTLEDWWDANKFTKHSIASGGIVLIDGCYSLLPELRPYYDFKIFMDPLPEKSKQRAIQRDITAGADPKTNPLLWEQIYFPQEEKYIQVTNPKKIADLTIREFNETEILIASYTPKG